MRKRPCELVRIGCGVKYCVSCKVLHVRKSMVLQIVKEVKAKARGSDGDHYAMALGAIVGDFLDGHPGEHDFKGVLLE